MKTILNKYNISESESEIKIYSEALFTQLRDTGGYAAFYIDHHELKDVRFVMQVGVKKSLLWLRPLHETPEKRLMTGNHNRANSARSVVQELQRQLHWEFYREKI